MNTRSACRDHPRSGRRGSMRWPFTAAMKACSSWISAEAGQCELEAYCGVTAGSDRKRCRPLPDEPRAGDCVVARPPPCLGAHLHLRSPVGSCVLSALRLPPRSAARSRSPTIRVSTARVPRDGGEACADCRVMLARSGWSAAQSDFSRPLTESRIALRSIGLHVVNNYTAPRN